MAIPRVGTMAAEFRDCLLRIDGLGTNAISACRPMIVFSLSRKNG